MARAAAGDGRPLDPERCGELLNVSRETLERLSAYVSLLARWNSRINLVGKRTLADVWRRHILDSGQLLRYAPERGPWVDLGSGAGLPGFVLAIMTSVEVHLVESDSRKCIFLREAARLTDTPVTIHNARIEAISADLAALRPQLITARALAPVSRLLQLTEAIAVEETDWLLLKGRDVEVELTDSAKSWIMDAIMHKSLSDPDGRVLHLRKVGRVKSD